MTDVVDQTEAGNAESRIALGVSDRSALGVVFYLARIYCTGRPKSARQEAGRLVRC